MRERLITLIDRADEECKHTKDCKICSGYNKGSQCMNYHIADYLIANGVVVPPCKVGDVVYMPRIELIGEPQLSEFTIKKIKREEDEEGTHSLYLSDNGQMIKVFDDNDIGKTVFLSREDAERALKGEKE